MRITLPKTQTCSEWGGAGGGGGDGGGGCVTAAGDTHTEPCNIEGAHGLFTKSTVARCARFSPKVCGTRSAQNFVSFCAIYSVCIILYNHLLVFKRSGGSIYIYIYMHVLGCWNGTSNWCVLNFNEASSHFVCGASTSTRRHHIQWPVGLQLSARAREPSPVAGRIIVRRLGMPIICPRRCSSSSSPPSSQYRELQCA